MELQEGVQEGSPPPTEPVAAEQPENGVEAGSPPQEQAQEQSPTLAEALRQKLDEAKAAETGGVSEQPEAEKPPPFHTHPRWQEVQRSLREAREKATALEAEKARYERLARPLLEVGLEPEQVGEIVDLARKLRDDPVAALEKIEPLVKRAKQARGEELPEDLEREVEDGLITLDRARELAKLRAEIELREQRLEETSRRVAQQRLEEAQRAIAARERALMERDPDFGPARPVVAAVLETKVRHAIARGQDPTDPHVAVGLVDEAWNEVRTVFGSRARPQVEAPPRSRAATPSTRPARTIEEAVAEVLARAR